MRYLLIALSSLLLASCSLDLDKADKENYACGQIATRDFKSFADQIDSILYAPYKAQKIVIPDSAKGLLTLEIFCVEKLLLDLVRDSTGEKTEKFYSARDTFSWISSQKLATSIFYALEGDSTCIKGMSDLNENYLKTGLPWILVIDAYDVQMPYLEDDGFISGVFSADVYLVDYKKKKVLTRFAFEGSSNETVKYKDRKLFGDNKEKKIKEDFIKNVNTQMSDKLAQALGESYLPGALTGLEEGSFFTNYSQTKKVMDKMKSYGDSAVVTKDSIK